MGVDEVLKEFGREENKRWIVRGRRRGLKSGGCRREICIRL